MRQMGNWPNIVLDCDARTGYNVLASVNTHVPGTPAAPAPLAPPNSLP
jgi:hypothetical protein